MNYPLISEYIESIKLSEENFEQLNYLRPVLDERGEPVITSGNFAVVFKMKDEQTGKLHAVKCFLKEQEGRAEAYRMISEELEYVNSTFLTPIRYLDKELFVDSKNSEETEFPVLLMDWVEGKTLDKYIREHIDDQYELSLLAYQFSRLAMWLMPQPFAHGDLKPDNIIVKEDGTLVLVDYDGMYVPAMKGQKARELGSPDFRHPSRTGDDFDEHIDDFSLASILLSLKAISLQPGLLKEYGASDHLLFSEKDYRNLSDSGVLGAIQHLMQDAELSSLYSLFILALSQNNLSQVSFRLFNLNRPDKSQYEEENLSTEVTEKDLANAWMDEYGVMYSSDRIRLLQAPSDLKNYSIRVGTKVICNRAFERCKNLSSITIPMGVLSIGELTFRFCKRLKSVVIPNSVVLIDKFAFMGCSGLTTLILSGNLKYIRNGAFLSAGLTNLYIPSKIEEIGDSAFKCCFNINKIIVDANNKFYDSRNNCNAIINSHNNTLVVGCSSTIIPDTVTKIGDQSFFLCKNLKTLSIPDSVREIGFAAFAGCSSLLSVIIPPNVEMIGKSIFNGCQSLTQVDIRGAIKEIPFRTFYNCSALKEISIPKSVITLGDEVFSGCSNLSFISLPNSVKVIDDYVFSGCFSLEQIVLPNSVTQIGDYLFNKCDELKYIIIPNGTRMKFEELLPTYKDKFVEQVEDYRTEVADDDLVNGVDDGLGVIYSNDGKRLLTAYECVGTYSIKNGTTVICDDAFHSCYDLSQVVIPESIKYIGENPFSYCDSLSNIVCKTKQYVFRNGALYSSDLKTLVSCISKEKEFHIPNSVINIANEAFMFCFNLVQVSIPNSVISIGDYAFAACYSLSQIVLPQSLNRIGWGAFSGCSSLSNIEIPDSVTSIDGSAFSECPILQVNIPDTITTIEKYVYAHCQSLKDVIIPNSVTHIGEQAFWDCTSLTKIVLPNSLSYIGKNAFGACKALDKIIIPFGSFSKFVEMIPEYKDKLVEQKEN